MREIIEAIKNSSTKSYTAVIGDIMIDRYLIGETNRISPEAPIQIVELSSETFRLGGSANVAFNIKSFEHNVDLFGVIGNDSNGELLKNELARSNIGSFGIIVSNDRPTTLKSRIIARHQQISRFDLESKKDISDEVADHICEILKSNIHKYKSILISDYGKGVVSYYLARSIINLAKKFNIPVLVDPKGKNYEKYRGAFLIKPNKKEAIEAFNGEISDINKLGFELINKFDFDKSIITLSEDGMKLFDKNGELSSFPTKGKEVFDVTGAGDTVLASIAVSLNSKLDLHSAIHFANSAAAVVISKVGTATASFDEILYLEDGEKLNPDKRILSRDEVEKISSNLKNSGKKVIFTNGCFDILHAGHVSYLNKARELGDILIVGLNSDSSVKKLKGQTRPINNENDRAIILSGLRAVDYVVIFEEDTPYELIKIIKPDVLVKGADYKNKEVVGSDLVKKVELINFLEGRSTTNIIKKIECNC